MRLAIALAVLVGLVAALSGCSAQPAVRTVTVQQHVAPALLTCAADPGVPQPATARQVGDYIAELWASGMDCRNKLAAVKGALGE